MRALARKRMKKFYCLDFYCLIVEFYGCIDAKQTALGDYFCAVVCYKVIKLAKCSMRAKSIINKCSICGDHEAF
jgi:hypothetical protein